MKKYFIIFILFVVMRPYSLSGADDLDNQENLGPISRGHGTGLD